VDHKDVRDKMLVWWTPKEHGELLCRVTLVAVEYIGLRVVGATPEAIIQTGYGIGENAYPLFVPAAFRKAGP
jgi:hypothetical protein